jgi:hypothetical protein
VDVISRIFTWSSSSRCCMGRTTKLWTACSRRRAVPRRVRRNLNKRRARSFALILARRRLAEDLLDDVDRRALDDVDRRAGEARRQLRAGQHTSRMLRSDGIRRIDGAYQLG